MNELEKILLIGRTGKGKSTLANVITNTYKFRESMGSASETRSIQFETIKENSINYLVIDTPGIGDTRLTNNQVLDIIAEAVYLVRDGVCRVFFVTNGRFEQYEMTTYNLLRTIIFDEYITRHTTIARTRFKDFKNKNKCLEDIDSMINIGGELAEIIGSCQKKVVHVDNPSVEVEDEEELTSNKRKRVKSRERVMEHLRENNCQGVPYKPPKLESLSQEITNDYNDYLEKKEELRKELENLKSSESLVKISQISTFESGNNNELISERKELMIEVESDIKFISVEEKIFQLEDKKTRLKREIEKKEKIIRQKVLKHILNGYNAIANEIGDIKKINPERLRSNEIEELRNNYCNQLDKETVPCVNLETLNLVDNNFTGSLESLKGLIKLTSLNIKNTLLAGSLDYLSGMEQLRELYISNTDINEVNIYKLPRSLENIEYSTNERPDCKLTEIVPLLEIENLSVRTKRQLSFSAEIQGENKSVKLEDLVAELEPMEIEDN
ncbi:AIG1 family-domain-containing protein [Glomus cerebriforme]|uniref:AIG1 family-domain-containing protein n=1 Tax=Glomus cerebriforme TaxID=658196 RepID=A0A397SD62_9GLOM|nr:AIG1 family-domain-containing protein [Glomus cerebriforme]